MNKFACIFDLDGVIVDTAKYHYLAWKRLAEELAIQGFDEAKNEELKGVSRNQSLEIILALGNITLTPEEKNELLERKNNWYIEYISSMDSSETLDGAKEFLELLKANNIKFGLASASKNAELVLSKIGLLEMFDTIVDGTKVAKPKPDPEVFTKCAENLGMAFEKCIVFEDAVAGVTAANQVKMKTIGIGSPEILHEANLVLPSLAKCNLQILNEVI